MFILLFFSSFVLFDAEAVKMLLDYDEAAWQRLGDTNFLPERDIEILADLAEKLAHWVPRNFLTENVTDAIPPKRGEVVRLEGNVTYVRKRDTIYACRIDLDDEKGNVELFVPSVPKAWEQRIQDADPIRQRVAAYAVYIKTSPAGLYKRDNLVFVAPAIEWYPDTWLGNLRFDVALLDHVPVSRVTEAEQNDEETNYRTFKFTESDREPFYSLLRTVSATPAGWLEEETKKQPFNETDLFNRPHETRGKPVLLHGTAKRIVPTPVADSEVHSLFGIDQYYQIFLYTEQSRGNPIVVCVHSLPEGMPAGGAADFAEQITVAAVPYKLWIYETSTGQHYAPVLVGRSPVWHPQPTVKRSPPESVTAFSFAFFFALVLILFVCRFWTRRSLI